MKPGATTALDLADFFRADAMRFTPVVIGQPEGIRPAFVDGRRDAHADDAARATYPLSGPRSGRGWGAAALVGRT